MFIRNTIAKFDDGQTGDDIYAIDQLRAMNLARRAWNDIRPETIGGGEPAWPILLQLFGNDQVQNLPIGHFSPTSKVLLLHIEGAWILIFSLLVTIPFSTSSSFAVFRAFIALMMPRSPSRGPRPLGKGVWSVDPLFLRSDKI
ncbi:BQ5605_C048g12369 [Microbotryum silenes-dioicae]|uniref:BQ5605_C048g12369 protein n=1 Tax=Microbotryum silenes-dioicae TaxID=796604 RepID=A0A2X0MSJ6_9BASI|nr:BQ5605_C048g12369 [Microbotryum silenes-dioicae]